MPTNHREQIVKDRLTTAVARLGEETLPAAVVRGAGPFRLFRDPELGVGSLALSRVSASGLRLRCDSVRYDAKDGAFKIVLVSEPVALQSRYSFTYDGQRLSGADTVVNSLLGGRHSLSMAAAAMGADSSQGIQDAQTYQAQLIAQGPNGQALVGQYYQNNWANQQAFAQTHMQQVWAAQVPPSSTKTGASGVTSQWCSNQVITGASSSGNQQTYNYNVNFDGSAGGGGGGSGGDTDFSYGSLYYQGALQATLEFLSRNKPGFPQYPPNEVALLQQAASMVVSPPPGTTGPSVDFLSPVGQYAGQNMTMNSTISAVGGYSPSAALAGPGLSPGMLRAQAAGRDTALAAANQVSERAAALPSETGTYTANLGSVRLTVRGHVTAGRTGTTRPRVRVDSVKAEPAGAAVALEGTSSHVGRVNEQLGKVTFVGDVLASFLGDHLESTAVRGWLVERINGLLSS